MCRIRSAPGSPSSALLEDLLQKFRRSMQKPEVAEVASPKIRVPDEAAMPHPAPEAMMQPCGTCPLQPRPFVPEAPVPTETARFLGLGTHAFPPDSAQQDEQPWAMATLKGGFHSTAPRRTCAWYGRPQLPVCYRAPSSRSTFTVLCVFASGTDEVLSSMPITCTSSCEPCRQLSTLCSRLLGRGGPRCGLGATRCPGPGCGCADCEPRS